MARVTLSPACKLRLSGAQAAGVGVLARRDAEHRLEAALQVKRALVKFLAQAGQRHRLVEMLLDEPANRLHAVRLRIAAGRLRPATQAGAVSRLLGLRGRKEELHVLPPRPPRRTRRPAIHTRRRNCENKLSVMRRVTRADRIPAPLVGRVAAIGNRRDGLRGRHLFQALRCEYGIGCHGKESLRTTGVQRTIRFLRPKRNGGNGS